MLRRLLFCFLLALLQMPASQASHIVGADMTYTCVGPNQYSIRLDLFQDCKTGQAPAIDADNPAFFGVYDGNGQLFTANTDVRALDVIIVPANFSNACVNNPPITCLQRTTFITTFTLPSNATGYRVVYQRCCRNGGIKNIYNPSGVGATYFVEIPPSSSGAANCANQSAVFKNYPPQIICINTPLVYDHSAIDPDGDSLSYEFCTAFVGGEPNDAKPLPPPTLPALNPVQYINGTSAANPVTSFPPIRIDAATGQITGTPNSLGLYVVTVCCHEWRNGVRINTTKREFQFEIAPCSKAVVADIPQLSEEFNTYIVQCESKTVRFINNSSGANTNNPGSPWFWDFGVPGTDTDQSTDFEPTFTYPDTGVYTVKLVVNRGSTCSDSIERLVKVYPTMITNFGVAGSQCPNTDLFFTDSTASTFQPVTSYRWNFGDGATAEGAATSHRYSASGNYTVTLISRNEKGCIDTAAKTLDIENFIPFAGNDTIIVQGERILFRARGGNTYTWTPATYLSDPNIPNPVGVYPDLGQFDYNVHIRSPKGCEGEDSIRVRVVAQSSIFVPSAFSPNGDGMNDLFRPVAIGFARINYFKVYNRWGQLVFTSSAFGDGVKGEGWDGRVRGEPADMGVYFWMISLINRFGQEEMRKGDVTLVR